MTYLAKEKRCIIKDLRKHNKLIKNTIMCAIRNKYDIEIENGIYLENIDDVKVERDIITFIYKGEPALRLYICPDERLKMVTDKCYLGIKIDAQ